MARRFTCPFATGSLTALLEVTGINGNTPDIVSSPVHSLGNPNSLRITSLTSGARKGVFFRAQISDSSSNTWFGVALQIATYPSAENRIIAGSNSNTVANIVWLTIDNVGTLKLYDEDGLIGTAGSTLSLNTWYWIELKLNSSGVGANDVVEARLNESVFGTSSTRDLSVGVTRLHLGGNLNQEAQTTGTWYFGDLINNNGTGSFENSYPGHQYLGVHRPSGAGDSTQWTPTSGANYTNVDEITPNDGTDKVSSLTLNQLDEYTLNDTSAYRSTVGTIKAVEIYARAQDSAAVATRGTIGIKASSGGTVEDSVAINYVDAWSSGNVDGTSPRLVLYDLPGASTTKWTTTNIDSSQIRTKITTGGATNIDISTMWVVVSYTAIVVKDGAISLQGEAVLSTSAVIRKVGAISLQGEGILSTSAIRLKVGAYSVQGEGRLTASGVIRKSGAISLQGEGIVTIAGIKLKIGNFSTRGEGILTINGAVRKIGGLALQGEGILSISGSKLKVGACSLSGEGILTINGSVVRYGFVSFQGESILVLSGVKIKTAALSLQGEAILTVDGTVTVPATIINGAISLQGEAILTISGHVIKTGAINLIGESILNVNSSVIKTGVLALQGEGILSALGYKILASAIFLQGEARMKIFGLKVGDLTTFGHIVDSIDRSASIQAISKKDFISVRKDKAFDSVDNSLILDATKKKDF